MGWLLFKCTSLPVWSQSQAKLLISKQFSCPAVGTEGKQDAPKCIIRLPKSSDHSVFTRRASSLRSWTPSTTSLHPFHSTHTRHPVHRGPEVRRLKNLHVSHQEGFWLIQKLLLTSFHHVETAVFSFQRTRAETGLEKGTYEKYIKQAAAGWWIQLKVSPHICTCFQKHSNRPCVKIPGLIWLLLYQNREPAPAVMKKKKKSAFQNRMESQIKNSTVGNWGRTEKSKLQKGGKSNLARIWSCFVQI